MQERQGWRKSGATERMLGDWTGKKLVQFNNAHAFQCMSRSHHPS
jgi:hypothetical protein